ncbi:hypothetical protein, partial [Rhodovulum sp. PH10]|uniref:hypothetical protein n=1 Tax=Rhodovulum sp. PH10 TaxID=1187851 RepID=UPI001ED9356A
MRLEGRRHGANPIRRDAAGARSRRQVETDPAGAEEGRGARVFLFAVAADSDSDDRFHSGFWAFTPNMETRNARCEDFAAGVFV